MGELSFGAEMAYGHWPAVILNTLAWTLAIYYFIRPRVYQEIWRFAVLCAFLTDEFVELYGYPLTLQLFLDKLVQHPETDMLSHQAGDLWRILFNVGTRYDAFDFFHLIAGVFIFGGLIALFYACTVLRASLESGAPATTGPYRWVRHPQYLALFSILLGYLIQGPTLITLLLFPVLIYSYVSLARIEEQTALKTFGHAYRIYLERTPGFLR
ncbi:MAG: methyltransferase family protein [Gammaproteobacteria bacterium]